MTTRDDLTARICQDLISAARAYQRPSWGSAAAAVDKPLPSLPLPPSPAPSPVDPVAADAAFIINAGRKARGLPPLGDDNPPDDNAPLRPGQLVLDAIRNQAKEGK